MYTESPQGKIKLQKKKKKKSLFHLPSISNRKKSPNQPPKPTTKNPKTTEANPPKTLQPIDMTKSLPSNTFCPHGSAVRIQPNILVFSHVWATFQNS